MAISRPQNKLLFHINDIPPWYLCVLFGAQHCLTMIGSTFLVPLIISVPLCMDNAVDRSYLICTTLFVSGIATLMQTTFGVRLPIVQGSTFAFLGPTFAILHSPNWACPIPAPDPTQSLNATDTTIVSVANQLTWKDRMCELQGAIIVAALLQIMLGASGVVGLLVRFISPITLATIVSSVGLGLFYPAVEMAAAGWPISLTTAVIMIICWQYLSNVRIPCPCTSIPSLRKFPIFSAFPIVIAVIITWILCIILTVTDVFSPDPHEYSYKSRTDTHINALRDAPWFRIPYPFQWGWPTFSWTSIIGMFTAAIAGMMESISDYYAAARLSGAAPPPNSALNRGALIEGVGCLVAGIVGTGNATTSYSENVGAIAVTRVGSRRVIQIAGFIILILGLFGKLGALFATIPSPIAGGILMVMFGVITSVGLSNLQYVDLNSFRNLFVIGTSIFSGLAIPFYIQRHRTSVNTGSTTVDQVIQIVLGTNMLVAGAIAIFLDLTLPGTPEERGLTKWNQQTQTGSTNSDNSRSKQEGDSGENTYDLPFIMNWINASPIFGKLPFCPTFSEYRVEVDEVEATEIQNLDVNPNKSNMDDDCAAADTV